MLLLLISIIFYNLSIYFFTIIYYLHMFFIDEYILFFLDNSCQQFRQQT